MKKTILITTGGSGGHVIPALILQEHLLKNFNVIISTDKRGLKFFDKEIYEYVMINTPRLKNLFFLPFNLIIIIFLTIKSYFILKNKQIEKVFSIGGYMSIPITLAAKFLNLEIYLIEPNQVLGRTNKFFLKSCKKIFCYSENIKNLSYDFKEKIITIYPLVRKHIYQLDFSHQINQSNKFTLLIVGGSQGANIFDKNLKNLIVNISKTNQLKIIQQTNERNISSLRNFYADNNIENKIFSFDNNFSENLKEVDLCITRAGASTLAELSLLNIPFIAVPLPTSRDNHQLENANFYKNKGCCWIIEQNYFDEKIKELIDYILTNTEEYKKKKENLKKLNYQNTWINVNQKIIENINEN